MPRTPRHSALKAIAPAIIALAGIAAAWAPARAQEAIPTAAGAPNGGAPMAEPADAPLRLSDHFDKGPDVVRAAGPCGAPAKTEDGKTDKSPHGEVWAGVGNHGYREGGGAVCLPLGDSAAVNIAVDAGQGDGWGRRH
jgi:hypothetical protein